MSRGGGRGASLRMYLLNLCFLQFGAVFGSHCRHFRGDLPPGPLAAPPGGFHSALLGGCRAARGRRAPQAHPATLVADSATGQHGAAAAGDRPITLGTPAQAGRDHVIVLDTSSWMAARSGKRTLMDVARQRARHYLRALPFARSRDAGARRRSGHSRHRLRARPSGKWRPPFRLPSRDPPPSIWIRPSPLRATCRRRTAAAPVKSPSSAAGRTAERAAGQPTPPPNNLRVIAVPDTVENSGLRKIGMRRSATDPALWEIYVVRAQLRNRSRATSTLALDFGPPQAAGRVLAGRRRLTLPPRIDTEASFRVPHQRGRNPRCDADAARCLPRRRSRRTGAARAADPDRNGLFRSSPTCCVRCWPQPRESPQSIASPPSTVPTTAGLVILDRFIPPQRPAADSIWIDPPAQGSPIPVRSSRGKGAVRGLGSHPSGSRRFAHQGFQARQSLRLRSRAGRWPHRRVWRPGRSWWRGRASRRSWCWASIRRFPPCATSWPRPCCSPTCCAGMSPEIFRRWEISGGSVGTVKLQLDQQISAKDVKVTAEDGSPVPFTFTTARWTSLRERPAR